MPSTNYTNRILTSMKKVFKLDGDYRCERDLHHHLTALFNELSSLRIGEKDGLVRYEHPSVGTYQWTGESPSSGNIDVYFVPNESDPQYVTPANGTGIEINCNYPSVTKVKQDLIKLLDPLNNFGEAVYVVVGIDRAMRRAVEIGLDDAITYLASERNEVHFSLLRVLLVEELGGWRFLHEGCVVEDADEVKIKWDELHRRSLLSCNADDDPMRLLSKEEAKRVLQDRMRQERISLNTTVARCMFETTMTRNKRPECHFGKTPLWDHVVELTGEQVPYVVFVNWLDKLVNYGKSRQR